jgi:adenosine deaminase
VNANFIAVAEALDLRRDEIVTLARNSFEGAFLDAAMRDRHLAALEAFAG